MFKGMSAIRHGKFVSLHLIICEHCLKESVGGGKKRKNSRKGRYTRHEYDRKTQRHDFSVFPYLVIISSSQKQ